MNRGARFLFVVALLSLIPTALFAQTGTGYGVLAGTIKDQTGAALPGVTIEAKSQEKGTTRTAVSDAAGKFRIQAIPLGTYDVTATLSGFETTISKGNAVESEKTTDVNLSMKLGATTSAITVTGDVPVVDRTNVTVTTKVRDQEFQKLPVGRNYQSLMGFAPGIPGVGGGNVNALGGLTSNNQFNFDGVDTTDPTTGTFGSNLNFEAIQEVSLYTAGLSAEYGRTVGAVVNVITKSGTNSFSGSAKWIGVNDQWNEQNKTVDQRCSRPQPTPPDAIANNCVSLGASLARVKFDHVNPSTTLTLGGPFWKDHVWFFGTYEKAKNTSARATTVVTREDFQQTTESPFWDGRVTAQITPSQNIWVRRQVAPTNGFIVNYGNPAELIAYTRQDQTSDSTAVQYTGVFGSHISAELFAADQGSTITVAPYGLSTLTNGAPHFSNADGFYYNGSFFDGFVDRPRKQFIGAISVFQDFMGRTHDIKAGYDQQSIKSGSLFTFQSNQLFIDTSFDPGTRTFVPAIRRDYDPPAASTSKGKIQAFYVRDKLDLFPRLFTEIGFRYEKQSGSSDLGLDTVDAQTWSPRLSASYDLRGDGRSLIVGSYARPYQFIVQGFSDNFAAVPQKANYTNFTWNGTQFVQGAHVVQGGTNFKPNTDLKPSYVDEVTFGYQRQLGNTMGAGIRGIWRKWGDLIDDIVTLNPDGSFNQTYVNYDQAKRNYRGVELTFEKRFSQNWNANINYTWSRVRGNQFADTASTLGDWLNSNCRSGNAGAPVDPTIGTNGVIPCSEVNNGARKNGAPGYDTPNDLKAQTAYVFHLGPVALTTGVAGEYRSNQNYTPNATLQVLIPGSTTNSGQTATYFYDTRGSRRLSNTYFLDGSLEATYRIWRTAEIGFKGEAFNLTNHQDALNVNVTTFCADTTPTATSTGAARTCFINRSRFASTTSRGSYRGPRSYRITTLFRF